MSWEWVPFIIAFAGGMLVGAILTAILSIWIMRNPFDY